MVIAIMGAVMVVTAEAMVVDIITEEPTTELVTTAATDRIFMEDLTADHTEDTTENINDYSAVFRSRPFSESGKCLIIICIDLLVTQINFF